MKWTRVESSMGENHELPHPVSMRRIKEALGITGRRLVLEAEGGPWKQYRVSGTTYTFTVTECS